MKTLFKSSAAVLVVSVAFLSSSAEPVDYLDWDGEKLVPATCSDYEVVTNEANAFAAGTTYVVKGEVSTTNRIIVVGTVENPTRIILCDGAKLTASKGVEMTVNGTTTNALVICGQTDGTGVLEATAGSNAAGIGGGRNGAGGMVTINGGTLTATGGFDSAGIGGGYYGAGGTVTINGGMVTATPGFNATGIGGGNYGAGGTVTINGGTVTATGVVDGAGGECHWAAGIGPGTFGAGGTVMVNGGTVTATGGDFGAGIGGGEDGAGSTVTINGGTVTATGGFGGAGIGSGYYGVGSTVTINGGMVMAYGGSEGAGIGGGSCSAGGTVMVTGGTVTAQGGSEGAGIGGGDNGAGGEVTIAGGTVTAQGGKYGAGIGGGHNGAGDTVTIRNGAVKVVAGSDASVIGHGRNNDDDGSVSISGGIFGMAVEDSWLAENNYHVLNNPDPETKGDYPYQVVFLYKLTVPQVEHATVEVTTNGIVVAGFAGSIDVWPNSVAHVAFTADPVYRIVANGEKEWKVVCNVTFGTTEGFPLPTVGGMPGSWINPWQVGENVQVYTNGTGVLTILGTGAMSNFVNAADVPWAAVAGKMTAVTIEDGVTQIGKNALAGIGDNVPVNGTPLSTYRTVSSVETKINGMTLGDYNAAVRFLNVGEEWMEARSVSPVPPAGAVMTWTALTNAVATAEKGAEIAVGADITEEGGELVVPKDKEVVIKLYGKTVSCGSVTVGGSLTVGDAEDLVGKIVASNGAKIMSSGLVTLLGGPVRGTFTTLNAGLIFVVR